MSESEDDAFYCFGNLTVSEARKVLPRLEEERIRFQVNTDFSELAQLPPAFAEYGTSGNGSKITLYVHRDDERKFRKVIAAFFKT
jgi:phosphoribulokinase